MSQSYFPALRSQPAEEVQQESAGSLLDNVQRTYVEQRTRLITALDASKALVGDLRVFNKDQWTVRYPQFRDTSDVPAPDAPATIQAPRRKQLRRSLTFADEPQVETEVVITPSGSRAGAPAVRHLSNVQEETDAAEQTPAAAEPERLIPPSYAADFQLLRLDIKLGHGSSAVASSLVSQLERSSIANLLDEKLNMSQAHLDKLRVRVEDTSSKVLVTGDLNAGKSTFVNALLQREIMPVDQQPCTSAFCEVHDCSENGGMEEVHVVKDMKHYSVHDESTFTRLSLSELEDFVAENESTELVLKLYLQDSREANVSLLNNGVADISLIDAPGLNRDNTKTTALFARQEEIDVVVFVVSAENHFTLSAKEFLTTASNEKAYIFIVVNKFEHIKNKEKCRRIILEQIKEFSPRTYEEADELVHFVDSVSGVDSTAFAALESSLRSFVLVKRAKSKLLPATTFLSHLLSDVDLLVGANRLVAQTEADRSRAEIQRLRPVLDKMKDSREVLEESLEQVEEEGARTATGRTIQLLNTAFERIEKGIPGIDTVSLPYYPGFFNLWDYVIDVRRALLASIDATVKAAEDEARTTTTAGVERIRELSDEHLPEGVERSRRVFMPEAMFSARARSGRSGKSSRRSSAVVAGGSVGLGLGLATRADLLEPSPSDIFDAQHLFLVALNAGAEKEMHMEQTSPTIIGVFSLGLGALSIAGGQAIGARALIEGVVRISDLFHSERARQWAAPVLGAVFVGAAAYVILEMPSSVPRTIGRRIRRQLAAEHQGKGAEDFVSAHADRVGRETRKVLRLAGWDLKERLRGATEDRNRACKTAEENEKKADVAVQKFTEMEKETERIRNGAGILA